MRSCHWVTITAESRVKLVELRQYDLDIQRTSLRQNRAEQWQIDGQLRQVDIVRLTKAGYDVTVRARETQRQVVHTRSVGEVTTQSEGYLSVEAIDEQVTALAKRFPAICQRTTLPHKTHEGRSCHYLRLYGGSAEPKSAILILGGAHAREVVNPDLLLSWMDKLCQAYTENAALSFGDQTYDADTIRSLLDQVEIFVLPLVNPDGRHYVLDPSGDSMWRKNRNPNPGSWCEGVDLNRNYDFLFESGIGTSSTSCSSVYRGEAPFSEPETKNVLHLMDTLPQLRCVVDVHSYSELILYPWGDDNNQSEDPEQNFHNPKYDGERGSLGDSTYREYIPQAHLDWYIATGKAVQASIAKVRGTTYKVEPGADLYPTTATAGDYPYTRSFTGKSEHPIFAFTIETGKAFQPPYEEGLAVIQEVSPGLLTLCLEIMNAPSS